MNVRKDNFQSLQILTSFLNLAFVIDEFLTKDKVKINSQYPKTAQVHTWIMSFLSLAKLSFSLNTPSSQSFFRFCTIFPILSRNLPSPFVVAYCSASNNTSRISSEFVFTCGKALHRK